MNENQQEATTQTNLVMSVITANESSKRKVEESESEDEKEKSFKRLCVPEEAMSLSLSSEETSETRTIWYEPKELCDFVLFFHNCGFHLHKTYLARDCVYFHTLFIQTRNQGNDNRGSPSEITIPHKPSSEFTIAGLHQFFEYVYGTFKIDTMEKANLLLPYCVYFNHGTPTYAIDQSKLRYEHADDEKVIQFLHFCLHYRLEALYTRTIALVGVGLVCCSDAKRSMSNHAAEAHKWIDLLKRNNIREQKVLLDIIHEIMLRLFALMYTEDQCKKEVTVKTNRIKQLQREIQELRGSDAESN